MFDSLKKLEKDFVVSKIEENIKQKGGIDQFAGIVLAPLSEVEPISDSNGLLHHFYGARILAGKNNFVRPHFHKIGAEYYLILSGEGEMNIGRVSEKEEEVMWSDPIMVTEGDTILVKEGDVHCLINIGAESGKTLDFAFAGPLEHLVNHEVDHPKGDRYFTAYMKNGLPPRLRAK